MIFASQAKEWEANINSDESINDAKMVMLDLLNNTEFGDTPPYIHASLSKPIRLQQFQTILTQSKQSCLDAGDIKTNKCETSDFSQYKILVVDDNLTNRLIAKDLLKQRHLIIADQAKNGKEAIEAIKAKNYDLVLMDCMMPDMDGYEATRAIRNNEAGIENKEITIVAFTANSSKEDQEKCFAEGMNDHLSKPIVPESLMKMLEKWLLKKAKTPAHTNETKSEEEDTIDDSVDINDIINSGTPAAISTSQCIYNPNRLKIMYGSDKETILEMLNLFLETAPEEMQEFDEAVANSSDLKQIRFFAHRMKGSAANFGGCPTSC